MYRKGSQGWLKHADFIALDMICMQIAYVLAFLFRGLGGNPYALELYRNMAILLGMSDMVVMFIYGTMHNVLKKGHYANFVTTLCHSVLVFGLVALCLYALRQGQEYSRILLSLTMLIYFPLTYIVRELWKYLLKHRTKQGGNRLLIVTDAADAEQVIQSIREGAAMRYALVGLAVIDEDWRGRTVQGVPVVANAETAAMYICQQWIDEVMLYSSEGKYSPELIEQLMETGVTLHTTLTQVNDVPGRRQLVERIGNYTVLTTSINYASSLELLIKRLMDIAGGLAGCIVTALLCVVVAPMIRKASPGPIFFAQERVGKNGKKFKMYKFRSMYMDAEERKAELMKDNKLGDGKMFKLDFDPRVIGNEVLPDGTHKTGVGDFLRRTSLDEFPQFFNILKGDMSLVGTRPPLVSETSLYELHHYARLAIKPGLTGMWQVSGRSDITDFEEVVRLDREYIANWNLGLDIKILLKTVKVVFAKEGSV